MFSAQNYPSISSHKLILVNNSARKIVAICLSLLLFTSVIFATSIFAVRKTSRALLKVSESSQRTNARALEGSVIIGEAFVFADIRNAQSVSFYLDKKDTLGNQDSPISVENIAPYDFAQSNSDLSAKPYDFSKLSAGSHTISATIKSRNGTLFEVTSSFTVGVEKPEVNPVTTTSTTTVATTTTVPVTTTTQAVPVVPDKPIAFNRQWVVYASSQDTPNIELYISKIDGTQRTRLTNDPNYSNAWPRVTPSGKTVFFYRIPPNDSTANYLNYSLWRINTDGTNLVEVLPKGSNGWWLHAHVDISPKGDQLVFAALVPFKGLTLFVSDLDGKNLKEIPTSTQGPIDPSWTPDGRIIFTSSPPGIVANGESTLEVYITSVDGKGETRLTNDNLRDHDPVVSPDGKRVSFLTHSDPTYMFPGKWTQRIMNIDGSNLKTLIGPDHFSANPYWVDNQTTVYGFWDWDKAAWGIRVTNVDNLQSRILVEPIKAQGLSTASVGDPFAFNR